MHIYISSCRSFSKVWHSLIRQGVVPLSPIIGYHILLHQAFLVSPVLCGNVIVVIISSRCLQLISQVSCLHMIELVFCCFFVRISYLITKSWINTFLKNFISVQIFEAIQSAFSCSISFDNISTLCSEVVYSQLFVILQVNQKSWSLVWKKLHPGKR